MRIELCDEEYVTLVAGGREITIGVTNLEPQEQLPELEIVLPEPMCANCWGPHLSEAPALEGTEHVRVAQQICIPIVKADN